MGARQRLFCLPSAGGGAAIYMRWTGALAPSVQVSPIGLPGREQRYDEPPARDCARLVAQLATELELDRPYALFGHSMGALIAFELACALRDAGRPAPACLVLSGYQAPQVAPPRARLHDASDARLLEYVRSLGGVPDEILANAEYLELMLPLMRADLELLETYRFVPRAPLACPVVVAGGTDDVEVPVASLERWREHTTGPFLLRMFAGGHFYLHDQQAAFTAFVKSVLAG